MKRFLIILCMMLFAGVATGQEAVQPMDKAEFPSLISAIRIRPPLDFCGEPLPLDHFDVRERLEKEMLLALWNRPQVILWLKRAGRYMPYIEKMLKEAHLPEDLKYVAVIESALRPHASSSQQAVGFWQFTRATGIKYGLTIDTQQDQRRNLFAATEAAIRYFEKLHDEFGSWTLAAAAYNMGEAGLRSEMLIQNVDNYYDLYIPIETQQFIFKIVSAKLIMKNPARYGFHLSPEDRYPSLTFDTVTIENATDKPLQLVAKAAGTTFKRIKDLNPQIRGHYLAQGTHTLLVPAGSSKGFSTRYQTLATAWDASIDGHIYIVKNGDSLSAIAQRFNVPLPALIIWNRLDYRETLHPGDRLIIEPGTPPPENKEPAGGD
jgi:membrane-bound lytic murein transglycosylase D